MIQREEFPNLGLSEEDHERLEKYYKALSEFTEPNEESLKKSSNGFTESPNSDIDEYFAFAARIGKPCFKWNIIKPAFLWKLHRVMTDMESYEGNGYTDCNEDYIKKTERSLENHYIMVKALKFTGAPFTFQRLCELITTPLRHYKKAEKFFRAIEKNINVVTTVTETGERVTGIDDVFEEEEERPHGIEQTFFVKENGRPSTLKKEDAACDDLKPMNLSAFREAAISSLTCLQKEEDPMEVDEAAGQSTVEKDVEEESARLTKIEKKISGSEKNDDENVVKEAITLSDPVEKSSGESSQDVTRSEILNKESAENMEQ